MNTEENSTPNEQLDDGDRAKKQAKMATGSGKRTKKKAVAAVTEGETGKRKSPAWTSFTKPEKDSTGFHYSQCIYCGKRYKAEVNGSGTSTLLNHHRKCLLNPDSEINKGQTKITFQTGDDGKVSQLATWHFDQNEAKKALARMIVLDELPFSFVNGEGFKLFLQVICPMFIVPSRNTVYRDAMELYAIEQVKMKSFFRDSGSRISLTTDTWTSVQQINYLCLTAHFIDSEWNLHKRLINFCPITSHRGEDIGKTVEKCLVEWGIDRIATITVDNASSNDTAIAYLKKKFNSAGSGYSTILGCRFVHMRCIAHIINLVVSDGISLMGRSVERIRAVVRYIKQSPARLGKFKSLALKENLSVKSGLSLDVPTRWNSTYIMLKAALRYEKIFEKYECEDRMIAVELDAKIRKGHDETLGMVCDDDWINIKGFMSFLKHFFDLTVRVSGSKYTTSNIILDEISDTHAVLQNACLSDDLCFSEMALKMKAKYDKYWGDVTKINLLIFIAHVFDPRHKMYFVSYVVDIMYDVDNAAVLKKMIDATLLEMFDEYARLFSIPGSSSVNSCSAIPCSSSGNLNVVGKPQRDVYSAAFKEFISSSQPNAKSELEKYLKEDLELSTSESSFNILVWWKNNSARYPVVSRMARDLLAIPISAVSSESAFSTGGRVLTDYRSCLLTTTVEALVCTQDWIRSESNPIALDGYLQRIDDLDGDLQSTANDADLGNLEDLGAIEDNL